MSLFSKFLVFVSRLSASIALTAVVASASHAALVRTVEAGKLTGATGVDVGGVLYDVKFVEGSCAAVFSGCDDPTADFVFATKATADAASQALLDLVFQDVGSGNEFDSHPELIFGCALKEICQASTPWRTDGQSMGASSAYNAAPWWDSDQIVISQGPVSLDFSNIRDNTWALWTPTATVPEPSSLALLGAAGVALTWSQRHRHLRANDRAQ